MFNPVSFNHLLYEYDDVLVSTNLDYTQCYQYEGLPLYGMPAGDYKGSMTTLIDALNTLEEGMQISFVRRNSKEHAPLVNTFLNNMSYNSTRKDFIDSQYKDCRAIEQFFFITARRQHQLLPSFFPKDIFQTSKKSVHQKFKNKLKKTEETFVSALQEVGLKTKKMSLNEVGQYSYYHLNNRHFHDIEIKQDPFETIQKNKVVKTCKTIREQVLHEPITCLERCIKVGDAYVGVLSLEVLGDYSDVEFYNKLDKILPEDNEIIVSFEKLNKDKFFKKLFHSQIDAQTQEQMKRTKDSDYELTKVMSKSSIIHDQTELMREVNVLNLECFKVNISITIRTDSQESCVAKIREIKKRFQSNEFHFHKATEAFSLTPAHFHSFLPGNAHQLNDPLYVSTLSLLYYLPINEYYKGYSRLSLDFKANQIYKSPANELIMFHSFDYGSNFRIKEITASTGSGKTFDIIKEIDGILSEKTEKKPIVLVVEPKRGMVKLTKHHKGEIISYNPASPQSYNPFPYKKDLYLPKGIDYEGISVDKDMYDPMLLSYFENLIELLVKEESKPSLSRRIKGIITDIITQFYNKSDENGVLILEDIITKIDSYKKEDDAPLNDELNRVKGNLTPYLTKQYKNIFQIREPLNLNNDLVYFDLSSMEESKELKEMCMYIMGSCMIRKLRVQGRPTYLFLDEASVFYQSKVGAKLLEFFVRQSRSLGGAVTIATQSAQDKLKSEVSDIVSENLSIRKCLYLEGGHHNLEKVGFNQPEVELIKNLHKKPGFYVEQYQRINKIPMLKKSEPDPFLYWLSTNDEADDQLFMSTQEKYHDKPYSEIIDHLAKDYPHGAN